MAPRIGPTLVSRDNWPVLEPLLNRALDLEGEERGAWLAELAARSPELAVELKGFLAEDALADLHGFLSGPPDLSLAGLQLGAYRLERPLGHGGMGTVWLANRADGHFEGTAAVKLLHLSLLSGVGQDRFRQEGSVLARLTHPNIAKLLDAGVTSAGQPYLILEYVDGLPIDVWVRNRGLSTVERIRLFLQVLAAVGHAHANLIVHRDLKPSNILVDKSGVVKLLDFGIAKLIDPQSGAGSPGLTADGTRLFTPEYASPEQVWGDALTTATDVYALGVLLYSMLSGRHPTIGQARSTKQILASLIEVEPRPMGLGDLDMVVAKALSKAPAERYQTVAAFADDIQRYLRQQPVNARPHSVTYRFNKFIARNRIGVAATVISAGALIGSTIFSVSQMNEARHQRDVALRSAQEAQAMTQLQAILAGDSRGEKGRPLTVNERFDLAVTVLKRQFGDQPWLVSEVMTDLSDRFYEMGDRASERTMLAQSMAVAEGAGEHRQAALAFCKRAYSYSYDDIIDSARADVAAAKVHLAKPGVRPDPRLEALCLDAEGQTLIAAGVSDSGIPLLFRAAKLVENDVYGIRLSTFNDLASGLRYSGRTREALPYYRRVMAELDSNGYTNVEVMPNMASFLVGSLAELGEMVAADSELKPIIRAQEAALGPGQTSTLLAFLYGQGKLRLGQLDSADVWISRALLDTSQGAGALQAWLPTTMTELRLEQGRLADARRASEGLFDSPRGRRATSMVLKARLLRAEGKPDAARALLDSELVLIAADTGKVLSQFALPYVYAGQWRLEAGDAAGADSLARRGLRAAIAGDSLGSERSGLAGRADLLLARSRVVLGDRAGAFTAAERAVIATTNGYGPGSRWAREAVALRDSLKK
ncbi:MAG TPA: protein kinase [Gemmatimonadales bacterium]|nr:protein kinase [Gemmatimonadales bacterium]